MRQWAGMADMTPDFAPIMGKTPVEGFYLDSGWGTWGFKATPVCGKTMAHTVVNDTPTADHRLLPGPLPQLRPHRRKGRGKCGSLSRIT
jgi:sarcosine oxidase subunit beta